MGLPKEAYVYYSLPTACFTMEFVGEFACGLKPVPWMMDSHIFLRADAIPGSVDM